MAVVFGSGGRRGGVVDGGRRQRDDDRQPRRDHPVTSHCLQNTGDDDPQYTQTLIDALSARHRFRYPKCRSKPTSTCCNLLQSKSTATCTTDIESHNLSRNQPVHDNSKQWSLRMRKSVRLARTGSSWADCESTTLYACSLVSIKSSPTQTPGALQTLGRHSIASRCCCCCCCWRYLVQQRWARFNYYLDNCCVSFLNKQIYEVTDIGPTSPKDTLEVWRARLQRGGLQGVERPATARSRHQ